MRLTRRAGVGLVLHRLSNSIVNIRSYRTFVWDGVECHVVHVNNPWLPDADNPWIEPLKTFQKALQLNGHAWSLNGHDWPLIAMN